MIKIYLPNISEQKIGGGWTFMRNFRHGMAKFSDVRFTDKLADSDVMLVSGVTLAEPGELEFAKKHGIKIVFRVDNVPKKSRNKRSRVYDNMRKFGQLADRVVFQSRWAKDYAGYFMENHNKSVVIYNGVNKEIFKPGPELEGDYGLRYIFVQFNRDENKRFPEAAYYFHKRFLQDKRSRLTLVGQFSPEMMDANFDFFANEKVDYVGVIEDPDVMASIYRDHDILLFPAFADAAPNTVLEARACGLAVECLNEIGGTMEMLDRDLDISLTRMCEDYYSLFNKLV